MRVLYFGTFDPTYGRNRVILRGLRANGVEVILCNGGISGGVKKFLRLAWRTFRVLGQRFDIVLVAFPAQEAMLAGSVLLYPWRLLRGTPVVVDMLTSHYDGYILDRKKYSQHSWRARWYYWLDRAAIRFADCAIVDSDASARFFVEQLHVPAHMLLTVPIGTDDRVMNRNVLSLREERNFLVHFHGKFIPHQGIGTILEAAHLLRHEKVTFQIIGTGQDYQRYRATADDLELSNITWIDSVPYEQLPDFIHQADICLGPMGGTGHFDRCAPNKIYEYMACGKAIISGRSKALEGIGVDHDNMMLVNPADAHDLSAKILLLKSDRKLREKISENAYRDFSRLFTPQHLMADFVKNLRKRNLLANPKSHSITIAITGARGFIGSRLSDMLMQRSYRVVQYSGDINDARKLEEDLQSADIIIHLAAKVDDSSKKKMGDDFMTVNVLGTQRVIDHCVRHHAKLLFFSSRTALRPTTLYGLSKYLGEKLVHFYSTHFGLAAVIMRPGNVYDRDGNNRLGKHVDLSRGRNYPLERLLDDVERVIAMDGWNRGKVRIITPRLFFHDSVLYWPRRVWNILKKIL